MLSRFRIGLTALIAVEAVLAVVPVIVLGAAIQWPASLGFPAEQILPLVQTHGAEMRWGYGAYLAYSVLFFPLVTALAWAVRPHRPANLGSTLAVGFAALSALARAVGILRWLVPVPPLAAAFVGGDAVARAQAVASFNVVDAYGGAVGEAFGIGLFGGAALLSLGAAYLGSRSGWAWWTLIVGAMQLVPFVTVFGVDLGPATTVAAVALLSWLVSLLFFSRTAADDAA